MLRINSRPLKKGQKKYGKLTIQAVSEALSNYRIKLTAPKSKLISTTKDHHESLSNKSKSHLKFWPPALQQELQAQIKTA